MNSSTLLNQDHLLESLQFLLGHLFSVITQLETTAKHTLFLPWKNKVISSSRVYCFILSWISPVLSPNISTALIMIALEVTMQQNWAQNLQSNGSAASMRISCFPIIISCVCCCCHHPAANRDLYWYISEVQNLTENLAMQFFFILLYLICKK